MSVVGRRTALQTLILGGVAASTWAARAHADSPGPAPEPWRKLSTEPYRGKQDDVVFVSRDHGWYGNGLGRVFRTTDGGESWAKVWERPGTYVRALGFVDARTGLLGNIGPGSFPGVTDTHPLYRTIDGGESWVPVERIKGPTPAGICAINVLTTPFINAGVLDQRVTLRAGGRVGGPAHLMTSYDRGETWASENLGGLTGAILDIAFINPRVGFIAGSSGPDIETSNAVVLRTLDGGASWARVYRSARPYEITWKLAFPSPRVGYVTVQNYDPDPAAAERVVAKTIDGGRTWRELPLRSDHALQEFGVAFLDEHRGWVGGSNAGYATRDGGRTWAPVDMGLRVNKLRVVRDRQGARVFAIGSEVRRLDLPA